MRSDWLFPLCTGEERLKGGDELTTTWLNKLLSLVKSCVIQPGSNSGLSLNRNDHGTFVRLGQPNVQAQLAITSGTITARVGTTAGFGTVLLVDVSVASDGTTCTLTTTSVTETVFSYSSTTGGIPTDIYVWIEQDLTGNWFITSDDCGN